MTKESMKAELSRLRTIFQSSNDAIFFIDVENDLILDANPRTETLLGYTREELLESSISRIHPHEMKEMRQFSEEVMKNGNGWTKELSCLSKQGKLIETEISASVVEFEGRPCIISMVRDVSDRERISRENSYLRDLVDSESGFGKIVGQSPKIQKTLQHVSMVSKTDATVLILGETGTGKELIAHSIHSGSNRSNKPFVRVNCASIPENLFESEFFGHIKGAFTGAIQNRIGRFELAEGGTLFLDEVSEIPLALQGKLLRVLQENQYEKVGDSRTRTANVRIIAATNRDLLTASKAGSFRADLYYRLSVFPIEIPALRERKEDIGPLAHYYFDKYCQKYGIRKLTLTENHIESLESQDWPGNIRELQNVIERAIIRSMGNRLNFDDVTDGAKEHQTAQNEVGEEDGKNMSLDDLIELEKQIISKALQNSSGKVYGKDGAAVALGIPPTTLNYRIKKLRLNE